MSRGVESLSLRGLPLCGRLPDVSACTNLKELHLSNCKLKGAPADSGTVLV